eukprot:1161854-Pelagomonas_calceolata.AAC.9
MRVVVLDLCGELCLLHNTWCEEEEEEEKEEEEGVGLALSDNAKLIILSQPGRGHNGLLDLLKRTACFWLKRVPVGYCKMVRFKGEEVQDSDSMSRNPFWSWHIKSVFCMHVRLESILKIGEVGDFRVGCKSCGCAGSMLSFFSLANQNKRKNGFPPWPAPGIPGKSVVCVFDGESTVRLNKVFAVCVRAVNACSNFLFAILDMTATISVRPCPPVKDF